MIVPIHIIPGASEQFIDVIIPVCYTALFGNYEELKEPTVITPGWRYICYTDQNLTSNVWDIVKVKVPEITDAQRYARWYKIMHWIDWRLSIWADAAFIIDTDLNEWVKLRGQKDFNVAKHSLRNDFYEECMDCIISGRGERVEVDAQMNEYVELGIPRHNGVIQSGLLLRINSVECIKLCEAWWAEMQGRSARDQIAFCRASIGHEAIINTYIWDYRQGKDFIYKKHFKYR